MWIVTENRDSVVNTDNIEAILLVDNKGKQDITTFCASGTIKIVLGSYDKDLAPKILEEIVRRIGKIQENCFIFMSELADKVRKNHKK